MTTKKSAPTSYTEAWAPKAPEGDVWTARPWVHPSVRLEEGRAARKRVPRASHAAFEPRPGRDPIAILDTQEQDRLPDLVPLRHARMAESPFTYYRGTPAVMAFDLAVTPRTDIIVQASGDAHLSNFGLFGSPERRLVFDANDFDETLPAPWEWDVKRLAASIVIAGRSNGFSAAQNRAATMADRPIVPPVDGQLRRHAAHRRVVLVHHCPSHQGGRGALPGPFQGCQGPSRQAVRDVRQGPRS